MYSAGWKSYRLSDIAEIDKSAVQPSEILKGTTFVGLENISESGSVDTTRTVSSGELLSTKFRFTNKHILYGKLRPYLKKIARPACDGICSTDILPILPKETVDRDFLYYFLRQPQLIKLATERSIGANLPRLSPTTLAEFEIAVPPIPIQKQIAAILEKADAAREKRRQANQLTEQFLQSAFLEMFGDPVTNPKQWMKRRVDDYVDVAYGYSIAIDSNLTASDGFPMIRMANVPLDGRLSLDDLCYVKLSDNEFDKFKLQKGDLLLNWRNGSAGHVGKTVLFEADGDFVCASFLLRLRPDTSMAHSIYLWVMLNYLRRSGYFLNLIRHQINSKFNATELSAMRFPLPSMSEQEKYAALFEKVESLRAKQKESKKELENLFNSLMQKAFRGKLVR